MDHTTSQPEGPAAHRIVIVGGGAGGLELATSLGRSFNRSRLAEITLIDATPTHLWKPLLHEVAAGTLNSNEDELSYLAQAHWHHFKFRLGRVQRIDRKKKIVQTTPTTDERGYEFIPARSFPYDTLIIAVGSISNDFGIQGVSEHCFFLDNRREADEFHQHFLRKFFEASVQQNALRPDQLKIAIAGAGATGVELAAELYHSTRVLVAYGLERIDPDQDAKITIIEAAERILPGLPRHLSDQVAAQLREIGVEVLTGERIIEAAQDGFRLQGGRFVPAEIRVWAAGIKAPDFLSLIEGLEVNRLNQLVVHTTLQTTRDDDIFAFGDCASCPMQDASGAVPPRAQAAHQQASLLARSLRRRLQGRALLEFRYVDYGSLINMSRYSTVGSLMGNIARIFAARIFVEGILARLVYLSLYKLHQLALHGMVRVGLVTVANLLTRRVRPRMKLH
ncbi:MAG: NAD(P)/FAD-dependent oxidoreductase [Gammaproteobacteria bacterium]|nr:NAD(P)/FAD-dependent oxidoreductase [Gammaproteobacteria bacterium]